LKAELIDYMGSDLTCVNAARVSFDKESDWEFVDSRSLDAFGEMITYETLSEKDQKLISYLAKHNHWSPFSHVVITMRETVPIFVARQRFKHVVGFTYNEVSRRYVDSPPEFFVPDVWRYSPDNAKQGSSDKTFTEGFWGHKDYKLFLEEASKLYYDLIKDNVAPEQARMVLPQSMYTSYYTTGSLAAWARAYKLRSDEHSQKEIQNLAAQWDNIISSIPELEHSWNALKN
jgi:thymidylate synthase (FAD)